MYIVGLLKGLYSLCLFIICLYDEVASVHLLDLSVYVSQILLLLSEVFL